MAGVALPRRSQQMSSRRPCRREEYHTQHPTKQRRSRPQDFPVSTMKRNMHQCPSRIRTSQLRQSVLNQQAMLPQAHPGRVLSGTHLGKHQLERFLCCLINELQELPEHENVPQCAHSFKNNHITDARLQGTDVHTYLFLKRICQERAGLKATL